MDTIVPLGLLFIMLLVAVNSLMRKFLLAFIHRVRF